MTEFATPSNHFATPTPTPVLGLRVFVNGPSGGNPVPLVLAAAAMSMDDMLAVARQYGHESAFVLPAGDASADWRFRFFVPRHEMEMCGHATVGTLWALRQRGLWTTPSARIQTLSGPVDAQWDEAGQRVWVSQPAVQAEALPAADRRRVAEVLGLPALADAPDVAMVNASTSRIKTLVALPDVQTLQALRPDFSAMEALCGAIGSTGLYPFALDSRSDVAATVFARQFPKSSGYPEDAATGIAAAALWGWLVEVGAVPSGSQNAPATCTVRQGDAMGCPSAIAVRARFSAEGERQGCWLSGQVEWTTL